MSYTKRQIVTEAFSEIGLGPYQYDLQPEDLQTALARLDALMAWWSAKGADTGYPVGFPGTSSLDDESNIEPSLARGVICALAVEIGPGFGKTVSADTRTAARDGLRIGMRRSASIPKKSIDPTATPAGAGYKSRWREDLIVPDNEVLPDERETT